MKLDRGDLMRHLVAISCQKQIKEVVFGKAFSAAALTPDHMILVLAPQLKGASKMKGDLGIVNLETMARSLTLLNDLDAPKIELHVEGDEEDRRLRIDEGELGHVTLPAADPRMIATRISEDDVEKILAVVGDETITLRQDTVVNLRDAFSLLDAEIVRLSAGPKGGAFRVGDDNANHADIPVPELKAKDAWEMLFERHLIDAFASVTGELVTLRLPAERGGRLVAIDDGEYRYVVSQKSGAAGSGERSSEEEPEPAAVE